MTRGGRRVRVLDRACDVGRDAERRAEQEALRASEERFRYATGAARGMTYEVSYPSWGAQLFGRETLLGYRSGQIGSNRERWLGLLHPEERRRFLAARPLRRIGFVQAGHDAAGEDPGLPAERDETLSLPAFWRTSNAGALMAAQPEDAAPIAAALIAWHERHGRHDLPWQREPTPYRVWVSEIMLQQTQVATVIGYYERFLRRFPDAAALAAAPLDEVLHLWSGLGYYSRARNLQRAAQCIVREHGGELPADPAALARLPGIGRSTAAAIAALAHGRRAAILDGNARRVLARYFAIEGPSTRRATQQELWRRAEQCTPAAAVAQYTQAIMDLGATLCTRRRPACTQCPLRAGCAAHRLGRVHELPAPRLRAARRTRGVLLLLAQRADGSVLLQQRAPHGVWGGLWTPPQFESAAEAAQFCALRLPAAQLDAEPLPPLRHAFTHFDLEITPWRARCADAGADAAKDAPAPAGTVMEGAQWLWYNAREPARIGLPAPIATLLSRLEK